MCIQLREREASGMLAIKGNEKEERERESEKEGDWEVSSNEDC